MATRGVWLVPDEASAGALTLEVALLVSYLVALVLVLATVGRRCPTPARAPPAPQAAASGALLASVHELCAPGDGGGVVGCRGGPDTSSSDDGIVSSWPAADATPCPLPSPAAVRARAGAAATAAADADGDLEVAAAARLGGVVSVGPFSAAEITDALGLLDGFGGARPKYEAVIDQAHLRFLRRPLSATANAFLTEGSLEACSPERFLALWYDAAFRREWDEGIAAFAELECGAVHHAIKYPYPLQPRFYLYDRAVVRATRTSRRGSWHVRSAWPAPTRADAATARGPDAAEVVGAPAAAAASSPSRDATAEPDNEVFLLLAKCAASRLQGQASKLPGVLCSGLLSFTAIRRSAEGGCQFAIFTLDEQGVPVPSWVLHSLLGHTYPQYMRRVHNAARLLGEREAAGASLATLCPQIAPLLTSSSPPPTPSHSSAAPAPPARTAAAAPGPKMHAGAACASASTGGHPPPQPQRRKPTMTAAMAAPGAERARVPSAGRAL